MRPAWLLSLLLACGAPAPTASPAGAPIRWIHDDYPLALSVARLVGRPLLIDMGAAWCRPCKLSQLVLADPGLADLAPRVVWLELDMDKRTNAPVAKRLKPSGYPTFVVVDPADESVVVTLDEQISLASARQLVADGTRKLGAAHGPAAPDDQDPAAAQVAAGIHAAEAGKWADAASAYAKALAAAPPGWPRRGEVTGRWIDALAYADDCVACIDAILAHADALAEDRTAFSVASAVECAPKLPAGDPRADRALALADTRLSRLVDDPKLSLTDGERIMALSLVAQARTARKDAAGARAVSERNLALVEELIAHAPSAAAAATFEDSRAMILVELERPDEAVAILERRERGAPDDLKASVDLADMLQQLKRYPEALAAVDRALAKGYGPFKSHLYTQKREILAALERRDEARKVLEEQVAYYRTLPDGQQWPESLAKLEKLLAEPAPPGK